MNSLTKLGTALTVVFVICVAAFIAQVLCVLWRRRSFRRRSCFTAATEDPESNTAELFYTSSSTSKELLYFLCWKNQSGRVEPDVNVPPVNRIENRTELSHDVDEDVLAKWQALYGPSRLLFTIKEEDREEAEADSVSNCNGNDDGDGDGDGDGNGGGVKRVCLRDCLEAEDVSEGLGLDSEVVMAVREVGDGTPFSTPCASPQYFTPSPSPEYDPPEKAVPSSDVGP